MLPLSANQLLNQKLISLVGALFSPLFFLIRFISSYFFRYGRISGEYVEKEFDFVEAISEAEEDEVKKNVFEEDEDEKEMSFAFKFPQYEEFVTSRKENGETISEIEAISVKEDEVVNHFGAEAAESDMDDDEVSIFSGFHTEFYMKKDEIYNSSVNQFTENSKEFDSIDEKDDFFKDYLSYIDMKKDVEHDGMMGENVERENHDAKVGFVDLGDARKLVDDELKNGGFSSEYSYSEKESLFTSSDSDSTSLEQVRSVMSFLIDSYSECFLSDEDFREEPEPYYDENPIFIDGNNIEPHGDEMSELEDDNGETEEFDDEDKSELEDGNGETEEFDDEDKSKLEDGNGETKEFDDEDNTEEHDELNSGFLTEKDFDETPDHDKENGDKDEDSSSKDSSEGNKMESLWEHQDLIEQLKMELKKVRATGLPTIFEDSESPKIMDDLKPWKIEEKFHHEDFLGELHKVYKTYYGRMRKFDILTYQKMYTIGFLHLKDPLQSTTSEKSSGQTFKSLLSQNSWGLRNRSLDNSKDPMLKFMKEMQSDFETVYVGQMCLSWEFLHWEYLKALDLCESDPHGIRRYNEVADEFQQFQVLIQRFLEDEKFQGPRVQYFIKRRCVLRNLLHVPVIREDSFQDKRKARTFGSRENIVTSDMLVDILEESIRILWRFIQADKDCSISAFKRKKGSYAELQSPEDHELLMEVSNGLQKKTRKLKEILRGKSCILRRFKRGWEEEDDSDAALYFFSQVDMKLVSRALNMSKITAEQLDWCLNKLKGINFVGRKMHVEGSFLLFPY